MLAGHRSGPCRRRRRRLSRRVGLRRAGIVGAHLDITNSGGNGAKGNNGPDLSRTNGAGGAGIVVAHLDITTSGSISGGLGGDGVTRADAVTVTGGDNTLALADGWSLTGNLGINGADTLLYISLDGIDTTIGNTITGTGALVVYDYAGGNVFLDVAQTGAFASAAVTPNQASTARTLNSLSLGNPLYDAIAWLPSDAVARGAFDQLSGQIGASARGLFVEQGGLVRNAAIDVGTTVRGTTVRGTVGWRHAFGDITPEATQAFAGSTPFTITGLPIACDALVLDAGLDVALSRSATLGLAYVGQMGHATSQSGLTAALKVRF